VSVCDGVGLEGEVAFGVVPLADLDGADGGVGGGGRDGGVKGEALVYGGVVGEVRDQGAELSGDGRHGWGLAVGEEGVEPLKVGCGYFS